MIFNKTGKREHGIRRKAALVSSFLCAALVSVTVFGTVSYDSSQDPIVAYSAMEKYVTEQLTDIRSSITNLSTEVAMLELGGGSGSGSGSGISSSGVATLLSRIDALEKSIASLESANTNLQTQLTNTRNELESMINDLAENHSTLSDEIDELEQSITSLNSQLKAATNRVSTLEKNFKQISDISTKLSTVTSIVNALTGDGGDIKTLKSDVESLNQAYQLILEEMGHAYEVVCVPVGSTIYAKDASDTLLLILRSGAAEVVSPYTTPGLTQGINDLTDGCELYNGTTLSLYHSVLIPRGGNDGRGVKVIGIDDAYFMIGGEYIIVEEQ